MNYYNEFDHKAAAWLRELIRAGLIPDGHVDTRSILDVQPGDLAGYTQCHFFAGIGGWSLALQLAGWPADKPVWTGSCPCQPFSSAGKQLGAADERHLWPAFFSLIRQCRPESVFGEQVANAIGKGWLDGVSADLEQEGYACGAAVLGAHSVGAPHIRQRLYWVANAQYNRLNRENGDAPEQGGNRPDNGLLVGGGGELCESGRLAITKGQGRDAGRQAAETTGHGRSTESAGSLGGMGNPASLDERRSAVAGEHGEGVETGGPGGDGCFACECDDDGNCPVCGTDFSDCPCIGPTQDDVEYDERPDGLFARRLGDALSPRLEGHAGNGDDRDQPGRIGADQIGPVAQAGSAGAWSDFYLVHCADGKTRRIGAGIQPLAHGIPGRVAQLRGLGNAIVPQVAAEFIQAFIEVTQSS